MTPKKIATLQAQAARGGRVVNVSIAPGGVTRVIVSMGHGPTVHYVITDGDAPLRVDPQCPTDRDLKDWTLKCDKVARGFEPLMADALGMPVRGRQTRHLAHLSWVAPLGQTSPGCASGSA